MSNKESKENKKNLIQQAYELYGEQRNFTEEERKIYKKVTDEESIPIGVNAFDLLREYKKNKKK